MFIPTKEQIDAVMVSARGQVLAEGQIAPDMEKLAQAVHSSSIHQRNHLVLTKLQQMFGDEQDRAKIEEILVLALDASFASGFVVRDQLDIEAHPSSEAN